MVICSSRPFLFCFPISLSFLVFCLSLPFHPNIPFVSISSSGSTWKESLDIISDSFILFFQAMHSGNFSEKFQMLALNVKYFDVWTLQSSISSCSELVTLMSGNPARARLLWRSIPFPGIHDLLVDMITDQIRQVLCASSEGPLYAKIDK